MCATWLIGTNCSLSELARAIEDSVFDVTCVTITKQVTSKHIIYKFLDYLVRATPLQPQSWQYPELDNVLSEKSVVCLENAVWLVVHRAKVSKCSLTQGTYRSGGHVPSVIFGHLNLRMNGARQKMLEITVGVLVVTGRVAKFHQDMLASWLTMNRVAVLCGFFGKSPKATTLARRTFPDVAGAAVA